jgi:hypothetical protein
MGISSRCRVYDRSGDNLSDWRLHVCASWSRGVICSFCFCDVLNINTMEILISFFFLACAAFCYGIISLYWQNKLVWTKTSNGGWSIGFWGSESWRRKYRGASLRAPKENWYYKLFKIKHEERFFGSATIFVWITDGFHLTQFVMIKFLVASVIFYPGPLTLTAFCVAWAIWVAAFQFAYLKFQR